MTAEDPDEHAIGYQVLQRGAPVVASDGEQVGTVGRVLHHGRENLLDGIVIKTDDGRRFVDAPEVARLTNKRVLLGIDAAAVRALPEPRGPLTGVQERAGRLAQRIGRRFGR